MRRLRLSGLLLLLAGAVSAGESDLSLAGSIDGRLRVHMTLRIDQGRVSGTYSYDKYGEPIAVRGTLAADGSLVLDEYDAVGRPAAQFRGRLAAGNRLAGRWHKAGDARGLPFVLAPADASASGWAGTWHRTGSGRFDSATLEIPDVGPRGFDFGIQAVSGGHTGELTGKAKLTAESATWRDAESGCQVTFALTDGRIRVDASDACSSFGGMGVVFGGNYRRGQPDDEASLRAVGVLDDAQEAELKRLAGADYVLFVNSFQLIAEDQDLDGLGATVRSGAVRGLFTEMEAIVMTAKPGRIWAAVIDSGSQAVKYFTNDPAWRSRLPKTIEHWREAFADKKVIFPGK
jgi:hypothetical protein